MTLYLTRRQKALILLLLQMLADRDRVVRSWWVHPVNQTRAAQGEFHRLFGLLKDYPERFLKYTRMTVPAFDELLNMLKDR
jgi:hypothetical protein